jgi:hypothetical protein
MPGIALCHDTLLIYAARNIAVNGIPAALNVKHGDKQLSTSLLFRFSRAIYVLRAGKEP